LKNYGYSSSLSHSNNYEPIYDGFSTHVVTPFHSIFKLNTSIFAALDIEFPSHLDSYLTIRHSPIVEDVTLDIEQLGVSPESKILPIQSKIVKTMPCHGQKRLIKLFIEQDSTIEMDSRLIVAKVTLPLNLPESLPFFQFSAKTGGHGSTSKVSVAKPKSKLDMKLNRKKLVGHGHDENVSPAAAAVVDDTQQNSQLKKNESKKRLDENTGPELHGSIRVLAIVKDGNVKVRVVEV